MLHRSPLHHGVRSRYRHNRSAPRSRSASAMPALIVQFDFPTHPHLFSSSSVYVPSSTWPGGVVWGVVLPLGSLGPSTGSREPSRVRPCLLDPTPLRPRRGRSGEIGMSRRASDVICPSHLFLPTISRVEASKALWPRASPSQSGLDVAVSCWRDARHPSSIAYSPTPSIAS